MVFVNSNIEVPGSEFRVSQVLDKVFPAVPEERKNK